MMLVRQIGINVELGDVDSVKLNDLGIPYYLLLAVRVHVQVCMHTHVSARTHTEDIMYVIYIHNSAPVTHFQLCSLNV
jgi:hypothetical protein